LSKIIGAGAGSNVGA